MRIAYEMTYRRKKSPFYGFQVVPIIRNHGQVYLDLLQYMYMYISHSTKVGKFGNFFFKVTLIILILFYFNFNKTYM